MRPHVLGVDDGPFVVGANAEAPIVGVMTEGPDLVEAIAMTRFPVDGEDATAFLASWITGLRLHPALQAIVLGGITIAGLGVVDLGALAERTALPVIAVSRRDPREHRVADALRAAGLDHRIAILERTPTAFVGPSGLHCAASGTTIDRATTLVAACLGKARVPEPLRLAHMIGRALAEGESRGRV
jgi:endonuclease V-like protein UPF0215 family